MLVSLRRALFHIISNVFSPLEEDDTATPVQPCATPGKLLNSIPPTVSLEDCHQSFEWPIKIATGRTLGVESLATPRTFRLVDCAAYCDKRIIRIVEWRSLDVSEVVPYAAISYVWRGLHKSKVSFAVEGAGDSDRIDLEVLRVACAVAVEKGAQYLWLDQLCIMQTDMEDKNWQIQNMATIYKRCHVCLVLPGGIGGLAGEGEITAWINRSWTLQEAVLPRQTYCIVSWTRGPGILEKRFTRTGSAQLHDKDYIVLSLSEALQFHLQGKASFKPIVTQYSDKSLHFGPGYPGTGPGESVSFSQIFSSTQAAPLALTLALNQHGNRYVTNGVVPKDAHECAIWRCVLMRTSSKDLDVVFSAMGLFGVALDPSRYETTSDALLALLQRFMENGGRANWLAASIVSPGIMPPLPVSAFQHASPVGAPDDAVEVQYLTKDLDWYLLDAPTGSLDDTCALKIDAPISPVDIDRVEEVSGKRLGFHFRGTMGAGGPIYLSGKVGAYAVKLGKICMYMESCPVGEPDILVMLLEPLGDRWRKVGMAAVLESLIVGWEKKEVVIVGDADGRLY